VHCVFHENARQPSHCTDPTWMLLTDAGSPSSGPWLSHCVLAEGCTHVCGPWFRLKLTAPLLFQMQRLTLCWPCMRASPWTLTLLNHRRRPIIGSCVVCCHVPVLEGLPPPCTLPTPACVVSYVAPRLIRNAAWVCQFSSWKGHYNLCKMPVVACLKRSELWQLWVRLSTLPCWVQEAACLSLATGIGQGT